MSLAHDEQLCFDLISRLWGERDRWIWVPRKELHGRLVELSIIDFDEDDETEWACFRSWIDFCLNSFAMSGPNELAWEEVMREGWSLNMPELFFRYLVERNGEKGYVHFEDLTEEELKAWTRRIRATAIARLERVNSLRCEWSRTVSARRRMGQVPRSHSNLAYSALACFRIGMSGSASFQRVRKS